MKRLICILFIVCIMLSAAACSNEPVAFTDSLGVNRDCFIDVVEITPHSGVTTLDLFVYCSCKLENGDTVWMEAPIEEYIQYVDVNVVKDDIPMTAQKLVYDAPVRLNGIVKKPISDLTAYAGASGKKVFRLTGADESVLSAPCTRSSVAEEYRKYISDNTVVYADLVCINPKYVIEPTRKYIVCDCTTANSDAFQLYLSVPDYRQYFEATADFREFLNTHFEENLRFDPPVRITGVTAETESLIGQATSYSGDTKDINKQLFIYKSIDEEQRAAAKHSETPEIVSYSTSRIEPLSWDDYGSWVICKCTADNGDSFAMRISVSEYRQSIDPSLSVGWKSEIYNTTKSNPVDFNNPITVTGAVLNRDDIICSRSIDLPETIIGFTKADR